MYQSVYNNKPLTQEEVQKKLSSNIITVGNNVLIKHNYGIKRPINLLHYIQNKHFKELVFTKNNIIELNCCLGGIDNNTFLTQISNIIR